MPRSLRDKSGVMARVSGVMPHSNIIGAAYHLAIVALVLMTSADLSLYLIPQHLYALGLAGAFFFRRPVIARETRWSLRLLAYLVGFGPVLFVIIARMWMPAWVSDTDGAGLHRTAVVVGSAGALLEIWALVYLWPSFSIEPAARVLVTGGPYRYLRHPIYLAGGMGQAGLWLTHQTWPLTIMLVCWLPCLWRRMKAEEALLARTFPEYSTTVAGGRPNTVAAPVLP